MLKIAQIKQNTCSFECMTYDDIQNDMLINKINDFVEITSIDASSSDDILNKIIGLLGVQNDVAIVSHKCFMSNTNSFFMFYISSDKTDDNNTNAIARFLSENHEPVVGTCVIINTKITPNENCDIDMSDILQIIRSKFIHHALIISTDDKITETVFYENPLENTHINQDGCRCVHVDILGVTFCVFLEHYPAKACLNKFATLLCKTMQIQGDVVVSLLSHKKNSSSIEVCDLYSDDFKKILCVRSNMSTADDGIISEEILGGHFYSVIDKYAKKFNNVICETIPDDVVNGQTMNSSL